MNNNKSTSSSKNLFVSIFKSIANGVKNLIPTKKDTPKNIIIKVVSIVSIITLIISSVYLISYFTNLNAQNSTISDARDIYNTNRDNLEVNDKQQYTKFDELKRLNDDLVGWISINNTEVDNPIYQAADNEYYITRDMEKNTNSYGAIFMDYRNNYIPYASSQNIILYGHNMRYGAMFGTLREYRYLDFFKANPIINFDTLYEQRNYQIFGAIVTSATSDSTYGYDFSPYQTNFSSQEEFLVWIEAIKQRSLYNTDVEIKPTDEILTLSTCCYDFDDARLVILAVRKDGVSEVDTTNYVTNNKVIYPAAYYEKKGKTPPKDIANPYDILTEKTTEK